MNITGIIFESENGTGMTSHLEDYDVKIHAAVLTVLMASVIWLLFANTVIVVCFIINRKKAWPTFVAQIFCLSVSDLFVGFVSIPWIILPIAKPADSPVPHIWCSLMLYLLVCSQCGSLYHMLTICAHRCFRIETSTKIANETQAYRRAPFFFALLAWVVSFVVCIFPFLFWTHSDAEGVNSCVLQNIFYNVKMAMGFIVIILFLPQALTNILYVVACLRLRCIWRRVFPVQSITASVQSSNTANTTTNGNGYSRASIRIQRRFMGTLGIVMLLFNICTLPVIVLAFFENKVETGRNFRYTACAFFIINSALNPFIYAFRSSWLKNALRKLLGSMCDCFICL